MSLDMSALDPKGLIREAYRIEGIGPGECRSIFLDWVLSLPSSVDVKVAIGAQLTRFDSEAPGHPMTDVLREGLNTAPAPGRRGGRRARLRDPGTEA